MGERDWASLEGGPLHDVFTRLSADVDAFNFRHVCRGWRSPAGAGALIPRPWFVLRSPTDGHCAFVRPTAGRLRRSRVKQVRAGAPRVRGASRGWLALDDGGRLLLRDPISRAEVPLPSFDDPAYQLSDVFLSDDPLAAPAGRWTAFAFFKTNNCAYGYPGKVLAFCRPGDARWARFDLEDGQQVGFYRGLEFFRGRAYVLVGMYMLAVCDVEARRVVACPVALQHVMDWESIQVSLVECGGNLLVAAVSQFEYATSSSFYCARHRVVRRFLARVVKIEFEEAGAGMPVGQSKVDGIGDHALFVAPQGHAFALPVRGFPAVRPGCVYHFATSVTTKSVSGMVVTELLLGQDPTKLRNDPIRKLPLAGGAGWRLGCWFCPRSPSLETAPARRRGRTLRISHK